MTATTYKDCLSKGYYPNTTETFTLNGLYNKSSFTHTMTCT